MSETKKYTYKYCIVPMCKSTTIKTPNKFFFLVPSDTKKRKKWCELMKRDLIGPKSTKYVCGDHFDVENDAENLVKYKLVGGALKMKADIYPHKFDCQKATASKSLMLMRECSVWLQRCDFTTGRVASIETNISEKPHDPQAAIKSGYKHDQITMADSFHQNLNEVKKECDNEDSEASLNVNVGSNTKQMQDFMRVTSLDDVQEKDFAVKEENKIYEVMIKQELDVGPTILQPRTTVYAHRPLVEARVATWWPCISSGGAATSQPVPALAASKIEVEGQSYEDNCEKFVEFNCNLVSNINMEYYAGERISQESTYNSIETQTERQCAYCVEVLRDYECEMNIPNIKADILTDGKKYECAYCGYKTNIKIDSNQRSRLRTDRKSYKCQLCEYSASQLSHIQSHMRRHTDERPYKCKQCEYSASKSSKLKRHARMHTGERPYKCKQCEYSASQLSHLQSHMRRHTGERPYKCKQCEYSASQLSHLQNHMRRHTGERPYKCKQCEYSASQLSHLQSHMRTHTGERPYKCKQCEYSASQPCSLRRHIRRHTGEKPYKCKQCE